MTFSVGFSRAACKNFLPFFVFPAATSSLARDALSSDKWSGSKSELLTENACFRSLEDFPSMLDAAKCAERSQGSCSVA